MKQKSLVQWVVSKGGIKPDRAMACEFHHLREYNRYFRGRWSLVTERGVSFDRLATEAQDDGFKVLDAQHFMDLLEQDARAWLHSDSDRVWPMDFDYYDDAGYRQELEDYYGGNPEWEDPDRAPF